MKFVYVLEDDPKLQKEIVEAIAIIDPKIQIRLFAQLETFVNWLRLMMSEGSAAIAQGGFSPSFFEQEEVVEEAHQLVLIISKIEYLGVKQISLLTKTRNLFIERKVCTKEDPTSIVLTAFDNPNFKVRGLENPIVSNIIFKPFDRLILIQHLTFAIDGRHPPSKNTITSQKATAIVEMCKDAPMEALSEFGFITRSNLAIEKGRVAKYYGSPFVTEKHKSIFGICDFCEKHPDFTNEFKISIRFFAADPTQSSNIRKIVRDPKAPKVTYYWLKEIPPPQEKFNIIIIDPEERDASGIGGTLERKFSGAKVTNYDDFRDFLLDIDSSQINSKQENPPKAFPSADLTFVFDSNGGVVYSFETANKNSIVVFNVSDKDIINKTGWCVSHLDDKHQGKFKNLFRSKKPEDNFFLWKVNGHSFLTKFVSMDKQKDNKIFVKFSEASKADWIDYLNKNSRCPTQIDAIFFSYRFLGEKPKERWAWVQDVLKKKGISKPPPLFLLSTQNYSDDQEREFSQYITEIFFKPFDRNYLLMKFHYFFPHLNVLDDPLVIKTILHNEIVKIASPITISEMSEAGFVMKYHRAISVGSFREMVLWQPYELGSPELIATCNFTEELQGEKGAYNCHFVFFGVMDNFLKLIRVWIRDNYIHSKEAN